MPTLVYLVHGIGCGTASGKPDPTKPDWSAGPLAAMQWITTTFGLKPGVVVTDPTNLPAAAKDPDSTWLIPISYHKVFDEFRASAADRAQAVKNLPGNVLVDADIQRLSSTDFLWANCLDVLMWWADTAQTRNWATTTILDAITAADKAARALPGGGPVRRILVSHSLGTAAVTWALHYLPDATGWVQRGAFDAWFTLANVSPFVLELDQVYDEPLIPGISGSLAAFMYNARQEFDPIPWLLFGRVFDPSATTISSDTWKAATTRGFYNLIQTTGVVAPKTFTPAISDVHGFANYLMAPAVATRLATHLNGEGFSDAQLAKINLPAAWSALPALRCTNDPQAYTKLATDVAQFISGGKNVPQVDAALSSAKFQRVMDAVELIGKATSRC